MLLLLIGVLAVTLLVTTSHDDLPFTMPRCRTQIMERAEISRSRDVTFGHDMAGGAGATAVPTKWSQGSHGIMERAEVSRSNDITFGHDMGSVRLLAPCLKKTYVSHRFCACSSKHQQEINDFFQAVQKLSF